MSLTGTKFSVLGADGFVGQALCRHLRNEGAEVRAFGRADTDYVSRPLGHAIYCIGLTADYQSRPFDTVEAHVTLFARILKDAAFESLTYLSSTRLYDSGDGIGSEEESLTLSPHNPRHLYDFSKGLGEVLCLTAGRANVRAARLACVYAGDLVADNFLHGLLRDALDRRELSVNSHPRLSRDYVHMDDVCRALAAIATSGRRQIYNVASGRNTANGELFALVERLAGCAITPTVASDTCCPRSPKIDVSALAEDFGIRPRALEDALNEIISRHASASTTKSARQ
jgi:UDP-glucose 4-epimerase